MRPTATLVLPTPELVPAMTTVGVGGIVDVGEEVRVKKMVRGDLDETHEPHGY